jgi:hypothetical protein
MTQSAACSACICAPMRGSTLVPVMRLRVLEKRRISDAICRALIADGARTIPG